MEGAAKLGITVNPQSIVNGDPTNKQSPEDIIKDYLHKTILADRGALFPIGPGDKEEFFKALSEVTGVKDTKYAEKAVEDFFAALAKDIKDKGDYNKDLDQNGDGVVDAKDLEKIFKEATPPAPGPVTK